MNLPTHKSIIRFTKVPAGSYASTNEDYTVCVCGKGRNATIQLTHVVRGVGTFDEAWAYRQAEWAMVA